jgi:hypothetical protein
VTAAELARARAEVRRLVAEGANRQAGQDRPAVITVAGGAK